ncbi:Mini-ribonuclease 3 [Paenibacillus turpanensis]|uniref:Mini-ribonuclease 3 n=1 Tax=Paenibacillus turpanensis TaxID=2689078 RepID=UPI001407D387|nr:Mini-ribonuclease 3 [Paenibacillus turpanensis]
MELTTLFPHQPSKDPGLLHPLALAYLGDAVYEVFVRQYLISRPNNKPNHMHREATSFVSAKAQCRSIEALMPMLSEEEIDIYKRGRNAKSATSPKNTDVVVYRISTGFECLIGYLYLRGRWDRLRELMEWTIGEKGMNHGTES